MPNKRKRPKSSRAGCLLCKPHKHSGCRKALRGKRARAIIEASIESLGAERNEAGS